MHREVLGAIFTGITIFAVVNVDSVRLLGNNGFKDTSGRQVDLAIANGSLVPTTSAPRAPNWSTDSKGPPAVSKPSGITINLMVLNDTDLDRAKAHAIDALHLNQLTSPVSPEEPRGNTSDISTRGICDVSPVYSVTDPLDTFPQNSVVKLSIRWYNAANSATAPRDYTCTATALSNIVLVTAAHCVERGAMEPLTTYPDQIITAYYGYDGNTATLGTRTARCFANYDSKTQADIAVIVLSSPMSLRQYRSVEYVAAVSPRTDVRVHQYSFAGPPQQQCAAINNRYGMLYSQIIAGDINMKTGRSISRCGDKPEIWTSVTIVEGMSGSCLIHQPSGNCIGVVAHDCEQVACPAV